MECDRNLCYTAIYNDFSCEECIERRKRESSLMDDLMQDAQEVVVDTTDTWNDAIDKVLEIINSIEQKSDDVSSYDVGFTKACREIRAAVQALKEE